MVMYRGGFRILKRGHSQIYHHCLYVGIARIYTVIAYEAHGHAKHANTRGMGACPPETFEK